MEVISQRVQTLPGELYDHVHREVFTAIPAKIKIDRSYKPPSCLQVNKSSRLGFAQQYYTKGVFLFDNKYLAVQWCYSLSKTTFGLLREVRLATEVNPDDIQVEIQTLPPQPAPYSVKAPWVARECHESFLAEMRSTGLQVDDTVIRVDAHFKDENGQEWMVSIN